MLFKVLTLGLIVLILVIAIYLIREYLTYLSFYTIEPPKDREKLRQVNQERQTQKHKVSNTSMIMLIVFVLITSFILYSLMAVKSDTDIIKNQLKIEKKNSKDPLTKETGTPDTMGIASYKNQSWKIDQFDWNEIVKNESPTQVGHEIELSKKLLPFVGENNVSIVKGSSLTISVFAVGLSLAQYEAAIENIPTLIADINKVAQVSIVDFTFTYYDSKDDYKKDNKMFYQENGVLKEIVKERR